MYFFFFQAEDGIRDYKVTGVQTCALPILEAGERVDLVGGDGQQGVVGAGDGAEGVEKGEVVAVAGVEGLEVEVDAVEARSEERRVGEEGRSRWSPDH